MCLWPPWNQSKIALRHTHTGSMSILAWECGGWIILHSVFELKAMRRNMALWNIRIQMKLRLSHSNGIRYRILSTKFCSNSNRCLAANKMLWRNLQLLPVLVLLLLHCVQNYKWVWEWEKNYTNSLNKCLPKIIYISMIVRCERFQMIAAHQNFPSVHEIRRRSMKRLKNTFVFISRLKSN